MKRRILMIVLALVGLTSAVQFFAPAKAQAFPGFARKYNFPCTFCHIAWPKLSDQGNYFHDRGFMLSTTGRGNGLDMMAFQPQNQNYWPLAWRTTVGYTGTVLNGIAGDPAGNGSHANGGYAGTGNTTGVDFLSGGLLNSYTSWWLVPTVPADGTFQIESAWVRFDNLLNTSWLNLKVGKSAMDAPFSVHRSLQLVFPYAMYNYVPGTPWIASEAAAGGTGVLPLAAYFDADQFAMANHHYGLQYFGYQFENGCGTTKGFSLDPCETRLTLEFLVNSQPNGQNNDFNGFTPQPNGANTQYNYANNGFSYYAHLTQSFGGWGATNGERIGLFALVGEESPLPGAGVGNTNPQVVFNREGFDLAANPIPNGGLNIFGAFEVAQDPTGLISINPTFGAGATQSGAEYMSWFLEADWMPTFGGLFKTAGSGSNMIAFLYNQVNMLQQPTFTGMQNLPGDFGNVLSFDITDRYWLWASNRTDVTLHFEYQFMLNYGVGSSVDALGNITGFNHTTTTAGNFSTGSFYNAESSNFLVGIDFAY